MDFKELFNLKEVNYWLLASAFALNGILTFMLFIGLLQFLVNSTTTVSFIQLVVMGGLFIVNFATAWIVAKMAGDMRGPTYGVVGSMSSIALTLFVLVPTGGVFGLLAAVVAAAGGFNGGLLSLPRHPYR